MTLTVNDLVNQFLTKEFSDLAGTIVLDDISKSHPKFLKETVREYCENTNEEETYYIYDLEYANVDDLLALIHECDFDVKKMTLDELLQLKEEGYEVYNKSAVGYYVLDDLQGANYGGICQDVFEQDHPTLDSFKDVLLGMIDRMEIYWEDYQIRFC